MAPRGAKPGLGVLAGGGLSGKYGGDKPPEGARFTIFPGLCSPANPLLFPCSTACLLLECPFQHGLTCACLPGYMERYTKSLAKEAVSGYCAVAKKHGMTPSQLALAWCKGRWNVTSTIIGATKMEQLKVRAYNDNHPLFYTLCCIQHALQLLESNRVPLCRRT